MSSRDNLTDPDSPTTDPDDGTGGNTDNPDNGNNLLPDLDFDANPVESTRTVVYGMVLTGVAWFVEPLFDALSLVFGGSQPSKFAAEGETWGLADIPVVVGRMAGNTLGGTVGDVLGIGASLIRMVTPAAPGPVDGIIMIAMVTGVVAVTIRYAPVVLVALLEVVPVIGPPLASIIRGVFGGGD